MARVAEKDTPRVRSYFGATAGAVATGAGPTCAAGGVAEARWVTGVTMTPVTSPLTASFFFLLVVPRATRVAFAFAVATMRCSAASGVLALGAGMPNSLSSAALLNVARR